MKRTALFLLVSILFCSLLAAQDKSKESAAKTTGTKYAVLIGVDDYVQYAKLRYTKNDVEALRDELYEIGFKEENVYCLTCRGKTKDLPTKENIEIVIKGVLRMAKRGDIVIIAMSGHGTQVSGEAQFCPMDTKEDDLRGTTVSITGIFADFEKSKATFKLMLVDACRNDPSLSKSTDTVAFQTLDDPPEGVMLLQSCMKGEKSREDPALERGVFTHYLVEGLRGGAVDDEGQVTLLGLAKYASAKTQKHVLDEFRDWQRPSLKGEITDFVLVEKVRPALTVQGSEGTKAGELKELTIQGVKYAFRWCPAGKFIMGTPTSELWRDDDEKQHQVTLTKGFWMLEMPVTQEMWESVTGGNPSNFKDSGKLPAETVSWNDCQEYINKLNALGMAPAGYRVSLPTEAQWEYACRAGTTTVYHFGNALNGDKANCDGNYPNGTETKGKYLRKTTVAGYYPANAWGLYDMHGNVREWCLDLYGDYPGDSVTDTAGPTTGSSRVLRGGCWYYSAKLCRSGNRLNDDPTTRSNRYGLRLALVRDHGVK